MVAYFWITRTSIPLLVEWFLISYQFKELQRIYTLIIEFLWTSKVPAIFGATSMSSGSSKTSHSGRYRDLIPLTVLSVYFVNDSASVICVFPDLTSRKTLFFIVPWHRPSDLFQDSARYSTMSLHTSYQFGQSHQNISGAKLGRASTSPKVNVSNLNRFVQFFDHLHGAGVRCNTRVICCIRSNRDVLADYFSVVSANIATSHEYWKCVMPKIGTLDFMFIFVAVVLAIVNMNKQLFSSRLSFTLL